METTTEAPAPVTTEAPAPQSPQVEVQPTTTETTQPDTKVQGGEQVDRGQRLAEINAKVAADPYLKLNDEELEIYSEGNDGKLKPKIEDSVEKPKVEVKADDPIQKAMKDVGAKTIDELPAKISELRKALSGKDAQAVASLTKELEGFRQKEASFTGATKFIADLKAGKPGALEYLQKELGVQLPKNDANNADEQRLIEEADILTNGMTSKALNEAKALRAEMAELKGIFGADQEAKKAEALKERSAAQIVDEALAVSALMPELKDLPNLRARLVAFQKGADDPGLQVLAEVFDYVTTQHKEKGLVLDPETAFYAIQGRNMAALIAKAKEDGKKEAYSYKKNPSLSGVATEDSQPKEYTAQDMANWEKDANSIPKEFFDKDLNLDVNRIPAKYRKVFGY